MLLIAAISVAVLLQLAPHHAAQDYYTFPGPPGYTYQPIVNPILNPVQTATAFVPQHDPPYGVVPVYRTSYKLPVGKDIAPLDIHKLKGPPPQDHKMRGMPMYMTPPDTGGHSPLSYPQLPVIKTAVGDKKPYMPMYMAPTANSRLSFYPYPQRPNIPLSVVKPETSDHLPFSYLHPPLSLSAVKPLLGDKKPDMPGGHSPFSYPQSLQSLTPADPHDGLRLEEIHRQRNNIDSNRAQKLMDDAAWNVSSPLKRVIDNFQKKFLARYKEQNIAGRNMSEIVEMFKLPRNNSNRGDIAPFQKIYTHHQELPQLSEVENKTVVSYVIKSNENYLLDNEPLPPKEPAPAPAEPQTTYPIQGSHSLNSVLQGSIQNSYSEWNNIASHNAVASPGDQYPDRPLKEEKMDPVWESALDMNNYGVNQYSVDYSLNPIKDPIPTGEDVSGPLQDDQYVSYYDSNPFQLDQPDTFTPHNEHIYDDKEYLSKDLNPNYLWGERPKPDYDYQDPRPPQFYYNDPYEDVNGNPSSLEDLSYPDHRTKNISQLTDHTADTNIVSVYNISVSKPGSISFVKKTESSFIVPTSDPPPAIITPYGHDQISLTKVDSEYIDYYQSEPPVKKKHVAHEFNITTSFKYVYENYSYMPPNVLNVLQSSSHSTKRPIIHNEPDYKDNTPFIPNYDSLFPGKLIVPNQLPLNNYPEGNFPTPMKINDPTDVSESPYDYPEEEYWVPLNSKGPKIISEIPTKKHYDKHTPEFFTPVTEIDTNNYPQENYKYNPSYYPDRYSAGYDKQSYATLSDFNPTENFPDYEEKPTSFSRPGDYLDHYLTRNETSYSRPAEHDQILESSMKEIDSNLKALDDYLNSIPSPELDTATSFNRSRWEKLSQSKSTLQQDGNLTPHPPQYPQGEPEIPEDHLWNTYPQYGSNPVKPDSMNFPSSQVDSQQVNGSDYISEDQLSTLPQYGYYPPESTQPNDEYPEQPDYNDHSIKPHQDRLSAYDDQLPETTSDEGYYAKPTGLYQLKDYFPPSLADNQPLGKLLGANHNRDVSPSGNQPLGNPLSQYQDDEGYSPRPDDEIKQGTNPRSPYQDEGYFSSPDDDIQMAKNSRSPYQDKEYFISPDYENQPLEETSHPDDKSYLSSPDHDNQPQNTPLSPYTDDDYFSSPDYDNQPLILFSVYKDKSKFSHSRKDDQPLPSIPHQETVYSEPLDYDYQPVRDPLSPHQENVYLKPPDYDDQPVDNPLSPHQENVYLKPLDYDNQPVGNPLSPYEENMYFKPSDYDNQPVGNPLNSYYNMDDFNMQHYDTELPYKSIDPYQQPPPRKTLPSNSGNQPLDPHLENSLSMTNYANDLFGEYPQPPRNLGSDSGDDDNGKANLTLSQQYVHFLNGTATIKHTKEKHPKEKPNYFVKTPKYPAVDDGLFKDEHFSSASYEYEFKKFHESMKNVTKSRYKTPFPKPIITKIDFAYKSKDTDMPKGLDIRNLFRHSAGRNLGARNAREVDVNTEYTGRSNFSPEAQNNQQLRETNTSQQVTADIGRSKNEFLQTNSSYESLDRTLVNKTDLTNEKDDASLRLAASETISIEVPARKNKLRAFHPMSLRQKVRDSHPR